MAILYKLTVTNPNYTFDFSSPDQVDLNDIIQDWPPQVINSDWIKSLKQVATTVNPPDAPQNQTTWTIWFANDAEAIAWMNANRLSPDQRAAVTEWKNAHRITFTEQWYQIPEYAAPVIGLFG